MSVHVNTVTEKNAQYFQLLIKINISFRCFSEEGKREKDVTQMQEVLRLATNYSKTI